MKKTALLLLVSAVFSCRAFAGESKIISYRLPVTRDGQTRTRLAYDFWSGEYPLPVIDLKSGVKGETKVQAYTSLRKLNKTVDCTIKNGIYNPWSKTASSAKTYYTISPVVEYEAKEKFILGEGGIDETDTPHLQPGDRVIDEIPLAEGYCQFTVVQGKARRQAQAACDELRSGEMKLLEAPDGFNEQWIYLSCGEGYDAFIQDKSLLAVPGAAEGEVIEDGKVGPKKP